MSWWLFSGKGSDAGLVFNSFYNSSSFFLLKIHTKVLWDVETLLVVCWWNKEFSDGRQHARHLLWCENGVKKWKWLRSWILVKAGVSEVRWRVRFALSTSSPDSRRKFSSVKSPMISPLSPQHMSMTRNPFSSKALIWCSVNMAAVLYFTSLSCRASHTI